MKQPSPELSRQNIQAQAIIPRADAEPAELRGRTFINFLNSHKKLHTKWTKMEFLYPICFA